MNARIRNWCLAGLASLLLAGASSPCLAATNGVSAPPQHPTPGLATAQAVSTVTGVAISPLLGVSAIGAWQYWRAPAEARHGLPWFAQPWFFIPALLLVGLVGAKDVLGTAMPGVLKKPFDAAELIENKISGLVAAGAFIPLIISIFPDAPGTGAWNTAASGLAAISFGDVLNALVVPFALAAFAVVWLSSHAIQVLILLSPFSTVDMALKAARLTLLGLVTATAFADPYTGALFCLVLILIAWVLAGWSFRLTVFGTLVVWDLATFHRHRFQPGTECNRVFTGRQFPGAPIRTFGKLLHQSSGRITFQYRPWLILAPRSFDLPEGRFVVGRGLIYPEILEVKEERMTSAFLLPPRHCGHEEALARAYGFPEVRDVGILKGFKALWNWFTGLVGARTAAPADSGQSGA